jgi:hypothetical protein
MSMTAQVLHIHTKKKLNVHRQKKFVKAFLDVAVDSIARKELEGDLCSARRARVKWQKLMKPNPEQTRLLRFIWMRNITFADSLGMNWTRLGGLFTRGYLEFRNEGSHGTFLRVVRTAEHFFVERS